MARGQTLIERLLLAAVTLPMLACGGDDYEPEEETPVVATPCADGSLTYASFGQSFFATYCAGCHGGDVSERQGAPSDYVFDTLEQVRALRADITQQAVVLRSMPFGSDSRKPSDTERERLGRWLACGAP